ncbi:ABC transporter substrate-binding protein [Actinomycetaceae bacterium TAE3-ERU4]|nr:ABC transporter substrate-binding protein [Actinomycetaceae bacterium TAE3-ERU4]
MPELNVSRSRGSEAKPAGLFKDYRFWAVLVSIFVVLAIVLVNLYRLEGNPVGKPLKSTELRVDIPSAPATVELGVIVSYTEDAAEGAGWNLLGEGANVARWRIGLSGKTVNLRVVSDKGTNKGAEAAVAKLKADGVSGIVALTRGAHAQDLAQATSKAGIPTIFPYASPFPNSPKDVWTMGPSVDEINSLVARGMLTFKCDNPVVVRKEGASSLGVKGANVSYAAGGESQAAQQVTQILSGTKSGCVVASADSQSLANLVSALRGQGVNEGIIASADAVNPLFAKTLAKDASSTGQLLAIAKPSVEMTSLQRDSQGIVAGVYKQATMLMSRDGDLKSLDGTTPFAQVASEADSSSHDAVVALVTAVARAGSADSQKVAQTLKAMKLESKDNIVDGPLDFVNSGIVNWSNRALVHATSSNEKLFWFLGE